MSDSTEPAKSSYQPGLSDLRNACLLLTCISLAVTPLFAGVGYARDGWIGILAAFIAAGVCWGGAFASLVVAGIFRTGPQVVHGVLLGMFLRMAVPLAACMILARRGGALVEAGAPVMILLYYFVTLIADTWLLLRWNQKQPTGEPVSKVS